MRRVRLLALSSTNRSSFAQTVRRNIYVACYPSVSMEEFQDHVECFGIDEEKQIKIENNFGIGKVRPLRANLSNALAELEDAISRVDLSALRAYVSRSAPLYKGNSSLGNPATLFDVYVKKIWPFYLQENF